MPESRPQGERDATDRMKEERRDDKPAGQQGSTKGQVGSGSIDERIDSDRRADDDILRR